MPALHPSILLSIQADLLHFQERLTGLRELAGFDINITRESAGPEDLRYSCRLSDPITSTMGIYGWGRCAVDAFSEAYGRRRQREGDEEDEAFRVQAAAIRDRHEANAQREIEALRSRPTPP